MEMVNVVPGSDLWEDLHRTCITGTDIAPLMLKKELRPKWMDSRVEVYLRKKGRLPKKAETAAMRRGVAMEEPAAQRYARRNNFAVYNCPMLVDGIFAANIDRLVGWEGAPAASADGRKILAKRIAEIKTSARAWGENPPMYYYGQPQWYLGFVPTAESADLVCWFDVMVKNLKADEPEEDFAVYNMPRNDEFIAEAREVASEFMKKYVWADVFPEVESEGEARLKWATSNNKLEAAIATKEIEVALKEIHRIDDEIEALTNLRNDEVAKIMKEMGDRPILNDLQGNMLVSWKSGKCRETVDWKGIVNSLNVGDDVIKQYTKIADKPSRPFKIVA